MLLYFDCYMVIIPKKIAKYIIKKVLYSVKVMKIR